VAGLDVADAGLGAGVEGLLMSPEGVAGGTETPPEREHFEETE